MKTKRCRKCSAWMPQDADRCIRCGHEEVLGADSVQPIIWSPPGRGPGRIAGAWQLMKQSWKVLMLDKELLLFPLMSGIASLLVLATFVAGIYAAGPGREQAAINESGVWVMLFLYYFASYFVIVFFNAALVSCALIRFQGGNPTIADGLRAATERLFHIAAWAAVAATVGVILNALQRRANFVGRIVIAMLGAAWTIATYFVVPVLVVEKLGPVDAFRRSASLMKKTWGESLTSNVGIGVVGTAAAVAVMLAGGALAIALSKTAGVIAAGTVVVVTVAMVVLITLATSALGSIVLTALYLYAAEKKIPRAFDGMERFAFERE